MQTSLKIVNDRNSEEDDAVASVRLSVRPSVRLSVSTLFSEPPDR